MVHSSICVCCDCADVPTITFVLRHRALLLVKKTACMQHAPTNQSGDIVVLANQVQHHFSSQATRFALNCHWFIELLFSKIKDEGELKNIKFAFSHLNSQGLGVRILFRHVLFPFTLTIKQLLLFLEKLTLEFCYLFLVVFQVAL